MACVQKVNAAPAVVIPLAFARKGQMAVTQLVAKYPVAEKLEIVKSHPAVATVMAKKELLLALLGVALILHGAQFKCLLLCGQVIAAFLYDRVKDTVSRMIVDVQTAHSKLAGDAPEKDGEEKDGEEKENKHAKKREAKKAADKPSAEQQKEDAETAMKALKVLDSDRVSTAFLELAAAAMACVLILQDGLVQKIALGNALATPLVEKANAVLDFPGLEDMQTWTRLLTRVAVFAVVLPLAIIAAPLALAMNASLLGAHFAVENGVRFLASIGKLADADAMLASEKSFFAICGLTAFGTFWQLWSWAVGGGVAWYFQVLYLPAVIAECMLGMF